MIVEEADFITVEDIMRIFRLRLDEREELRDVVIEYKIGISETFKENKNLIGILGILLGFTLMMSLDLLL